MDGLYRHGQYEHLLDRLRKLRGSPVQEDHYEAIQNELNEIIKDLRNRGDSDNARMHFFLLMIPMCAVLIWHVIRYKSFLLCGGVALMALIAFILIKSHMTKVIRNSKDQSNKINHVMGDKREFILAKMDYLESAMDIKKARLLLVAITYILFFPIFLVLLHQVLFDSMPFDHAAMAYFVAFAISGVLWYLYYDRGFDSYDQIERALTQLRGQL